MNWPVRSTLLRITFALTAAAFSFGRSTPSFGQGAADQFNKILPDAEKLDELKKERQRPPIEFFRSQVMPNDILPYIKANHWSMVGLEMRANHEDYEGSLQSRPVTLANQPHEMIYRRDARPIKGQNARLTLPIFLPMIPKDIGFQLIRPEAIRQDEEWMATLKVLEPHQQMVVVLSKSANDAYARWSQYKATLPVSGRRDDQALLDKQRYYRMVLPLDTEKPLLSPHPLTWSSISHVIWDGQSPETLGVGQQQAILDWLHWGGQLVIVGGAGPSYAPLRESFLADYLPAEPSGENVMRSGADLRPLSEAYRPAVTGPEPDEAIAQPLTQQAWENLVRRYKPPAPIPATAKKPIFISALSPRPGATVIPLGGPNDPPLAVEWKVGRGRVTMLAISLTDPDIMGWPGFDTFVRRVVLRRPEENKTSEGGADFYGNPILPGYNPLNGTDLTQVRYLARDLGAPSRQALDDDGVPIAKSASNNSISIANESAFEVPVGEWLDTAVLPILSRDTLEKASGIEIPGRAFVLKVILSYILILVPLNYLICRYLIGRREWAWVVVPTLSLAFAIGVERAAAYDVGFDSSCDEIDLIETHGDYPRGHVSRFASLFSTGRVKFTISYPNDPTALALPMATGLALRGEDLTQSSFQTQPIPALTGFQIQPRSLAMFRAEQMASLPGTVTLSPEGGGSGTISNECGLDLEDAWVVRVNAKNNSEKGIQGVAVGKIPSGAKVPLGDLSMGELKPPQSSKQLDPGAFLELLIQNSFATKPEEVGELRLIGWSKKLVPGQTIEPAVDRPRGFTLLVAHLEEAPLLSPASARYNALSTGEEIIPPVPPIPDLDTTLRLQRRGSRFQMQQRPNMGPTPPATPGVPNTNPPATPAGSSPPTTDPSSSSPKPNPNARESRRP